MRRMKVEEIAEESPSYRRINSPASVAGSPHSRRAAATTPRSSTTATKLGRLAGRAFAELKKRGTGFVKSEKEPRVMSLMGQKQTCAAHKAHVRYVPQADNARSALQNKRGHQLRRPTVL